MKLYFRRSGGFAPIFMGLNIDTAENPAPDLEALVQSSGIMNETSKKVPQARDVYYYTFDLDVDGKKHKVTFDQLSVPEKVKPLLEYCNKHAKNMMPDE